jgi:hypothetical protein
LHDTALAISLVAYELPGENALTRQSFQNLDHLMSLFAHSEQTQQVGTTHRSQKDTVQLNPAVFFK